MCSFDISRSITDVFQVLRGDPSHVASEAAELASSARVQSAQAHAALLRYLYNPLFSVSPAAWPAQGCFWDLEILSLYLSIVSG